MIAREAHKDFIEQLRRIYSNNEAAVITDWVFEWVTGWKRSATLSNPGLILEKPVYDQLQGKLSELLKEKPVQYVLGEAWFYKLKLKVTEAVLIPRPETEELVEWLLHDIRQDDINRHYLENEDPAVTATQLAHENILPHNITVLDIGTGSGCIAISIKKALPHINVIAIDYSEVALDIARQNAVTHGTAIDFMAFDFLDESNWSLLPKVDIIVSNPPYIPEGDLEKLANNVALFEPHLALFVPDITPLLFYEKIGKFADGHLSKNGRVYVETHEDYTRQVDTLYRTYFTNAMTRKDIFNKSRMVKAIN